jgi:DNA replication protein DnaC
MNRSSNDYYFLLEARRSKKFAELDNRVRTLSIDVAKGNGDKKEYEKLLKDRNKQLEDFINEQTKRQPLEFGEKTDSKISKWLASYCDKFPKTKLKNLVLSGAVGSGKTWCAKIIGKEFSRRGYTVLFDSAYSLIKQIRMDELPECDVLIIDDLGAEPMQKNNTEYLYTIIAERYENNLPFIITTNLSPEHILDRYEERLAGRILDKNKTAVINFSGKDLRIE